MYRLKCKLFGCHDEHWSCGYCLRCGAHYSEARFIIIERGWLYPLRRFLNWLGLFSWPRCVNCGKSLFLKKTFDDDFCSPSCSDNYMPF